MSTSSSASSSSYLPTGSTVIQSPEGSSPGKPTNFSEALMKAKEIAARLTGKGLAPSTSLSLDTSHLTGTKKRSSEDDESEAKRLSVDPSAFAEAALNTGNAQHTGDGVVQVMMAPKNLKTTIEFVVPGFKVGLIIGTRGETLKRFEKSTDTKITFDPLVTSNPADMPERHVFITGLPDDVENCKRLIMEKTNEVPSIINMGQGASALSSFPPGSIMPVMLPNGIQLQVPIYKDQFGNPLPSEQLYVPNSKVGLIIGRGGETVKDLQDKSGARVYIAPDASVTDPTSDRYIAISGGETCIQLAKRMLEDLLEGRPVPLAGPSDAGKITVNLTVPDSLVGLIIGRRGEYFKWIVQETRTRIVIDPPVSEGRPSRSLIITGTPENVAHAQAIIHEKLSISAHLEGPTTYVLNAAGSSYAPPPYSGQPAFQPPGGYYQQPPPAPFQGSYASPPQTPYSAYPQPDASTDPYAAYYQQFYAAAAATTPNPSLATGAAASPAASEIPTATTTAASDASSSGASGAITYTESQLASVYKYYYDYYAGAGLDPSACKLAAQAAMKSASLPSYEPGEKDKKETSPADESELEVASNEKQQQASKDYFEKPENSNEQSN